MAMITVSGNRMQICIPPADKAQFCIKAPIMTTATRSSRLIVSIFVRCVCTVIPLSELVKRCDNKNFKYICDADSRFQNGISGNIRFLVVDGLNCSDDEVPRITAAESGGADNTA